MAKKVEWQEIEAALIASDGNRKQAADICGISERRMYARLAEAKRLGIHFTGVHEELPAGHAVKGVSTYYGEDGSVKGQWVKTQRDNSEAFIQAFKESLEPVERVPRVKAPRTTEGDILTAYPLGDPHVGMYSYWRETGENYNLDIAEKNLVAATQDLVERSPSSHTALIANLGDFFHADTSENRTLQSGNVLDVDTRWSKVLRTGIRIMRTLIETALTKHKNVTVVNAIGNHDEHTSQMLALALGLLYEKNPRVSIDDSPSRFHYVRFGLTMIGVNHGDKVKPVDLPGIMATDRAQEWGETQFRYWLTGHVHNQRVFEFPGCLVESFRTLAAKDSWHAAHKYRSGRSMQSITYHKEYGEVGRQTFDIRMAQKYK